MYRKEWKEAGKQFGFFIAALAIVAFIVVLGNTLSEKPEPFTEKFFPILQISLLTFALISGLALFATEKKQKGIEYLFSLPYTRMQILIFKLIPRLAVILVLYIGFLATWPFLSQEYWIFSLFSFSVLYFVFYFISLSLSIFSDNFIELALFSFLMIVIYVCFNIVSYLALLFTPMREYVSQIYFKGKISLIFFFELDKEDLWTIFPIVIFLIPFLTAFVFVFRRLDVRSVRTHLKKYLSILIPGLFISLILSGLWVFHHYNYPEYSQYYLTRDLRLFQFNFNKTINIYDGQNKKKITYQNYSYYYPMDEYGNSLFCRTYVEEDHEIFADLIRFDLDTLSMEKMHRIKAKQEVGSAIWKWRDYLIWLEKSPQAIEPKKSRILILMLYHLPSQNIKKLELDLSDFSVLNTFSPRIIGADRINVRDYWIFDCMSHKNRYLLRLWDDGTFEKPMEIHAKPFYKNHMLFLPEKKSMMIYRITACGIIPIKELTGNLEFFPLMNDYYYSKNLDESECPEIYAKKGSQLVMINLADFSILPVISGINLGYDLVKISGKEAFLFHKAADGKTEVYRIIKSRATLIRTFDWPDISAPNFYPSFLSNGVVVRLGKKVRAYAFPDLREVKYEGLD